MSAGDDSRPAREPVLPPPSKPTWPERYRSLQAALRTGAAKRCFVLPAAVFALALIVGFAAAPHFTDKNSGEFTTLFSTVAQLIVTILVALALELATVRELNARWQIAAGTLTYVALGAIAAVVALNPHLGPSAYRALFALAMAAGLAALLSVLMIALEGVRAEFPYQPPSGGDGT